MNVESLSKWKSPFDPNRFSGCILTGTAAGIPGGIAAGIAVRLVMRAVALISGTPPTFSVQGSLFILGLGAFLGMWIGILFGFLLPFLPGLITRKGFIFGLASSLTFATLFLIVAPEGELALAPRAVTAILLASVPLIYGIVLGLVSGQLVPRGWEFQVVSKPFAHSAGLLTMVFAALGVITELAMAAESAGIINLNFSLERNLARIAGGSAILMSLTGCAGLVRSPVTGESRLARPGFGFALVGITVLGVVSVSAGLDSIRMHNLIWLMAGYSPGDNEIFLLLVLLIGELGLLAAGFAVLRSKHWGGWRGYIILATGLVPLLGILLMHPSTLPTVITTLTSIRTQMGYWLGGLWSLGWLALGAALRSENSQQIPKEGGILEIEAASG